MKTEPLGSLFQPPVIPYVPPGRLDFYRINALALDRLGDILDLLLPAGGETPDAYWVGAHSARPMTIRVSLLSGAWEEINTGRTGRDLISLVAHLFGLPQAAAARRLAAWLGASEVRHA